MKIKRIQNVTNYCVTKNNVFLANKDRVIKSLNNELEFNEFKFDGASMFADGDFLIIPVNPSQTFIFDLVKKFYDLLDFNIVFKSNYRNKVLVTKTSDDSTYYFISQYDLIQKKITYTSRNEFSSWNGDLIGNSYYYIDENQIIHSFHIPTEITLWQYPVADLGAEKVSKIIGVFGQTLVVVCKMPVYPEHILIGIDIKNGKLLWSVNLPQYLMHSNLFYYEQNNSIISLRRNFLWEFSLSSMEVLREKQLPETFKYNSLNVQVELASLFGDFIYFAGKDLENVRPSALVGVFDLKTEKLVDVHDLQSDGTFTVGGNSRPQVSGNKIYVQDTKNTLHILERESDALNEQG